jgi:hypothetical protein
MDQLLYKVIKKCLRFCHHFVLKNCAYNFCIDVCQSGVNPKTKFKKINKFRNNFITQNQIKLRLLLLQIVEKLKDLPAIFQPKLD